MSEPGDARLRAAIDEVLGTEDDGRRLAVALEERLETLTAQRAGEDAAKVLLLFWADMSDKNLREEAAELGGFTEFEVLLVLQLVDRIRRKFNLREDLEARLGSEVAGAAKRRDRTIAYRVRKIANAWGERKASSGDLRTINYLKELADAIEDSTILNMPMRTRL